MDGMTEKVDDDIRDIADRLRDLAIRINMIKGNSASADMKRCVNGFWRETKSGYQRKTLTTLEAIALIEAMREVPKSMSDWHKGLLPGDISGRIDGIFVLVRAFLSNARELALVKAFLKTDASQQFKRMLEEEASRPDTERAQKLRRDASAATRRAEAEARQALQQQTRLENARDLKPKASWSAAREKLAEDVRRMEKTYNKLVSRVGDAVNFAHWNSAGYLHVGDILGGLGELSARMWLGFSRTSDTH